MFTEYTPSAKSCVKHFLQRAQELINISLSSRNLKWVKISSQIVLNRRKCTVPWTCKVLVSVCWMKLWMNEINSLGFQRTQRLPPVGNGGGGACIDTSGLSPIIDRSKSTSLLKSFSILSGEIALFFNCNYFYESSVLLIYLSLSVVLNLTFTLESFGDFKKLEAETISMPIISESWASAVEPRHQ